MLPSSTQSAMRTRRAALGKALGKSHALIAAGAPSPRNFPANHHEYRASSHFLYFAGVALPGAMLYWNGRAFELFVPTPPPDDALWHGPTPSLADIEAAVGCKTRPIGHLIDEIDLGAGTVGAADAPTRMLQEGFLQRELTDTKPSDRKLWNAIVRLRSVHDEDAQAELRKAAATTTLSHHAGMRATQVGKTEHEIRAAMEHACRSAGMGLSYQPIVTTHGEILHNHHYTHALCEGDLLLADVGAETPGGWAGDVTRTWPVSGTFSSTQREIYNVVLQSEKDAIAALRPGVRYRDIHLLAAKTLTQGLVDLGILKGDVDEMVADGVHALFFPHGVGHLIGLDVHDMEDLGDLAGYAEGRARDPQFGLCYLRLDRTLEAGMAVTIEPGFYQVPGILNDAKRTAIAGDRLQRDVLARFSDVRGIRIEDDVLVTENDHEILTEAIVKNIDDVEAMIASA